MIQTIMQFFNMSGYGFYIWTAYGSVIIFLFSQWFTSWRCWRKYISIKNKYHE